MLSLMAQKMRELSSLALLTSRSGHAGLPFGSAELGAYLFGKFLNLSPENPNWLGRDRFILSAGHGSLLLYTSLHLLGFPIFVEDIESYRSFGSITPSHPDIRRTIGVEATTGLDGQGIGYAVGIALGMKINQARFNRPGYSLFDAKCVVLAGDGCFMEGISSESSSFAGHLGLDNLILIYDCNKTSLDGYTEETFSENVLARYGAYDWETFEIDGYDFKVMDEIFRSLRSCQKRPALILAHTVTGKGIDQVQGTPLAHGNPYENLLNTTHLSQGAREKDNELKQYLEKRKQELSLIETKWQEKYLQWKIKYPELENELLCSISREIPENLENELNLISFPKTISGRKASHKVLNFLAVKMPELYGGSADLSRSDMAYLEQFPSIVKGNFAGRNIKFGVREFGMCTAAIGMALTQTIRPFIGTYLSFIDYMTSGIRMAALMRQRVIFQLTHDSFYVGHDGPTHQPIEQIAHLRAIPDLLTIRPAVGHEVKMAWLAALLHAGPTAIILSRHELPIVAETERPYSKGMGRGGYILQSDGEIVDFVILASGSEISLAQNVAKHLRQRNYTTRLVSMPCQELFDTQEPSYQEKVLGRAKKGISIEAGCDQGWHKYVGREGVVISVDRFGESGSPQDLSHYYNFTEEEILKKIGVLC